MFYKKFNNFLFLFLSLHRCQTYYNYYIKITGQQIFIQMFVKTTVTIIYIEFQSLDIKN